MTEIKFQKPVIVYNYPKGIKAFYMRLNDDLKTVAAMDVLVPKVGIFIVYKAYLFTIFPFLLCHICEWIFFYQVGELIGGSQREERYEVIQERYEAAFAWFIS